MQRKYTERGFRIYDDFQDAYGKNIRIQRSSLASNRCVWIQNEVTTLEVPPNTHLANAHLTVKMAKKVIAALQAFVDGED
jgi:hypothetical protein